LGVPLSPVAATADDVGSSVIQLDQSLHIDAKPVHAPDELISSTSRRPVFFGYTLHSVTVNLFSDGKLIGTANSDETGYWRYSPIKNLHPGKYAITMQLTDPQGFTGDMIPVATLSIPVQDIKPMYGIPIPTAQLSDVNYITVPLLILAGATAGGVIYLLTKKHNRHEIE
jgi:hypothetical protein